MASYSFHIRKADHPRPDGTYDLHVHIYKNEPRNRRLLGRYRLPGLDPVFPDEPQLSQGEVRELAEWLSQPAQLRKLESCLRDTVFDMHRVAQFSSRFGKIVPDGGDTYINIRIPISRPIQR